MKLSIAIPTRSRATYLQATLRTVARAAALAGCAVETVVSDNASDDHTAQVCAEASLPGLRHVLQPRRLSMRQNFEAALDACTGSHILFIGDDDGVAPSGLLRLHEMITAQSCDIYKWRVLNYLWPDPSRGQPGSLALRTNKLTGQVQRIDPAGLFQRFLRAEVDGYQAGGMIYHGCVSRALVDRVREAQGGTYFWTVCPDVYASVANLLFSRTPVLSADIPVTIGGTSPRSNGKSGKDFAQSAKVVEGTEFAAYLQETAGDPCLGRMPPTCPSIHLVTVDALQLALRFAGRADALNADGWARRVAAETRTLPLPMQEAAQAQARLMLPSLPASALTPVAVPVTATQTATQTAAQSGAKVRITLAKVTLQGGTALDTMETAAPLIDRLCDNSVPFHALPQNWAGLIRRGWHTRQRAAALAKAAW